MRVTVVLIALVILTSYAGNGLQMHDSDAKDANNNLLSGGWIEEIDGIKVLHVSGTNYEMGYQHGYLLKNETREDLRAILNDASKYELTMQKLLQIWNITKNYIPHEYIQELHGLADGAGVSFEEVAAAYMAIISWGAKCFGIAMWGNATKDGKLYFFRSFDLPMDMTDPLTGKKMHDNAVLIVRQPKNGYASISPSIAGSLHGGGGFNTQGIAIGMHTSPSHDYTFQGIPAVFRVQQVLDHASNIQQAVHYLITNRTAGWTFIVADAKIPVGYAVETTASHYYAGTFNNSIESTPPFWEIKDVVRRTNFFIAPELAATQRPHYDPSGIKGFIRIFEGDPYFVIWRSYKAMSRVIEKNYGNFDLNTSMQLFQQGYRGDTDLMLKILIKLAKGTSFNRAWNMWVACPENGDMVVSFAHGNKIAFDMPYHYFNLYKLLNHS